MLRVLAAGVLIVVVGAAPAWAGWAPVTGARSKGNNSLVWWDATRSPDSASYWSSPTPAPGGEVDVDVATAWRMSGVKPTIHVRRIRLDCETGVGREASMGRGEAVEGTFEAGSTPKWSSPRFYGQVGAYDLTAFACGGAAAPGDLPDLKAVTESAADQLGYNLPPNLKPPPMPLVISRAPRYEFAPPAWKDLGSQSLIWERPGKAVFLMDRSLKRADGVATGRAIWLSGAGAGKEQQGYLVRDFQADCAARTLNLAATDFWPREEWSTATRGPSVTRAPITEAETALLSVACSEKSTSRTLASVSELLAYAEEPGGDLAFVARRQVTISASSMLWAKAPSEKALVKALPAGAVASGKTETTLVRCVVGQDYRLEGCEGPTWGNQALAAAHLALMNQFKPERTVNGADTMGRRVESLIEWTSEGGRTQPVLVPPNQMRWALTPSIKALGAAYGRAEPARAALYCRVSPARVLDRCSAIVGRGASLKRITERNGISADITPDEALGVALLELSHSFVPALSTTIIAGNHP
jgi:hypothetical protein